MSLRKLLLVIVRPITLLLNKINFRTGKPRVSGRQYNDVIKKIRPGDIVLTRNFLRPSNLFIPGYWSHVQIVAFDNYTVEARIPRVGLNTLVDVWATAHSVMIVRPKDVSQSTARVAADMALSYVGAPYDTAFEFSDKAFYCSELVYKAYRGAGLSFGNMIDTIAGSKAITPSAFDSEDFIVLFDSRKEQK